jgi:WD40 repeat protein
MTGPIDPTAPKRFRSPGASALSIDSSGHLVFGETDGSLEVRDQHGNRVRSFQQPCPVSAICLTKDPTMLFSATKDGNINLWNLADGKYLCQLRDTRTLLDARVSQDGQIAMTIDSPDRPGYYKIRLHTPTSPRAPGG